jgi:hypothetical protein
LSGSEDVSLTADVVVLSIVVDVVTSSVATEVSTGLSALHPDNTITADIAAARNFLYLMFSPS